MHSGLANGSSDLKTFQLEFLRKRMHSGLANSSSDLKTFQLESLRKRMHSGLANTRRLQVAPESTLRASLPGKDLRYEMSGPRNCR